MDECKDTRWHMCYDARSVSHYKCIDHNVKCVCIRTEGLESGSYILPSADFK